MDEIGKVSLEEFRSDAREWLEANFPKSLAANPAAERVTAMFGRELTADQALWKERMASRGWGTPTWPVAYGGGGLSAAQAQVLQQELARIRAVNPIGGMGVIMFGPTLLEYGTEQQKLKYVPGIVAGKVRWCQGFSEPGAGSDLAGLQTRADDMGDHFLVNGQKTWTSHAEAADMIFCLVRTDRTRKHDGISFVVFSMHQPGVEIRPIKLISGPSTFSETFLTDVKVPKDDLIGPLNGGWAVAKRLLQHERSEIGDRADDAGAAGSLGLLAKQYVGEDDQGRLADPDLRTRIVMNEIDGRAVSLTIRRAAREAKGSAGPSAATSIMKNANIRTLQERAELTVEIMGFQGLGWEGAGFSQSELAAVRGWVHGKAASIYGGSNEVQNNIIAKRILGLPDPVKRG